MQAIDILHKQIKHLSVMLVEMLRKETLKHVKVGHKYNYLSLTFIQSEDSEQTIKQNTFKIFKQALLISKWINK
jgi:hypothetical protein